MLKDGLEFWFGSRPLPKVGNWHADTQHKTIVSWDLTPAGKGTHVKVTHSGLATEQVARDDYRGGWPGVVASWKQFVEK